MASDRETMPERIWANQQRSGNDPDIAATQYIRADLAVLASTHQRTLEALREALERAAPYLLDAVNEHDEKIKALAGYPKLIARQEAYKVDVEADMALIDAALARIKEATDAQR